MAPEPRVRGSPIIIPPPSPSDSPATLIFVHGYNFLASQFIRDPPNHLNVAHYIHTSPALQHVKVIIAAALPSRHPSVPKNVWYDIPNPVPRPGNPQRAEWLVEFGHSDNNADDMEISLDYFESLIRSEIRGGTLPNRIVFMGDSQGAGMVVLLLLTRRIAADVRAMISYAGFPAIDLQTVLRMQREHGLEGKWSKDTTLFMLHGKEDRFIPLEIAGAWRSQLQMFQDRGQGIARIDWKLLDDVRHALIDRVWPHVREILERAVPVMHKGPSHKL